VSVYVFTGPTISADEARKELPAVYLPPVSQGDVYRVARLRPKAIGIIDGYFERVPSVWHKEILWAMSQGIHVYGSSSMGALRAAELAAFGMEGVGPIFEAFRDGRLEDDDEVAVVHSTAEADFRVQSEAMVNIRRTLADAEAAGILTPGTRAELERIAKALFYPERSYPELLFQAREQGLPADELGRFRAWLPTGRVDQKREDALALLRVLKRHTEEPVPPKRVTYTFEHTHFWEMATLSAGDLPVQADSDEVTQEALLEELRLGGEAYHQTRREALLHLLAVSDARRQGCTVDADTHRRVTEEFRRKHELYQPADVERWLREQHLTLEQLSELMRDEALLEWAQGWSSSEVSRRLPDQLRVSGQYSQLLKRARDKRRTLEARGLDNPSLAQTGLTADELVTWYAGHIGQPIRGDLGLYARSLGFEDREMLLRAIVREYCYVTAHASPTAVSA
jgi:hypothetical protein